MYFNELKKGMILSKDAAGYCNIIFINTKTKSKASIDFLCFNVKGDAYFSDEDVTIDKWDSDNYVFTGADTHYGNFRKFFEKLFNCTGVSGD